MNDRISTLISALCFLAALLLLTAGIREYQSGASPLWVVLGGVPLSLTLFTLVRDLTRLRPGAR
ncbi:hypothetical protein ACWF94_16775 [Streptomyces sp. NPDC055078]